jgi:hypothetical protein
MVKAITEFLLLLIPDTCSQHVQLKNPYIISITVKKNLPVVAADVSKVDYDMFADSFMNAICFNYKEDACR